MKENCKLAKQFLKEKGLYEQFKTNVRECPSGIKLEEHSGNSIINSSFVFHNTPEGYDFWQAIHNEFGAYLAQHTSVNI